MLFHERSYVLLIYLFPSAYRQSKQANRLLTAAFASRLYADQITVTACHPGVVNTALLDSIGTLPFSLLPFLSIPLSFRPPSLRPQFFFELMG